MCGRGPSPSQVPLTHGPHTAPPPQTQQSKFVNWQVDGEYRGSDFTAAVTLGNPDVLVGSGKRWGLPGAHEALIQIPFLHKAHGFVSERWQGRSGLRSLDTETSLWSQHSQAEGEQPEL